MGQEVNTDRFQPMPTEHPVSSGECISSIAFQNGFFWETLWNHADNAELKEKRGDPNVLLEGDVVHIPDLTEGDESCASDQEHAFKLKGVPARLNLKIQRPKPPEKPAGADGGGAGDGGLPSVPGLPTDETDDGTSGMEDPEFKPTETEFEPVANAPYVFEVEGVVVDEGSSDGDGKVSIAIVPDARSGKLIFHRGKPEEFVLELDLGVMDPVTEVSGVRKRLSNLGYFCSQVGSEDADDLRSAVICFQNDNSLEPTGGVDDELRDKLKELHGS